MSNNISVSRVENLRINRLRLPLRHPYKLSFGAVDTFDTILVSLDVEERRGHGEATVLTGYTEETIEGAWSLAQDVAKVVANQSIENLWSETERHLKDAPFTVTAFRTAAEMALSHWVLSSPSERRIPLLRILNGETEDEIVADVEEGLVAGYHSFKIKVGFELEDDLARVAFIQRVVAGRARLTIDANQGFSREEGIAFAERVTTDGVLFFEQACDKNDWDAAVDVARAARTSVMLDEQIYDLADVHRAASLNAAQFVKLKLMKMGSLDALIEGISIAGSLGLSPVLGNGVATDIGCWMEACAAAGRVATAGEMNGFLKPIQPIVKNPLCVHDGAVVIPPNYWPEIDEDAIARFSVASAHFGSS